MPKPTRLIFVSDLHLGAGKANDFHKTYQLHKLLDYACEEATELILLGDFLELLQNNFFEIYEQHHPLFVHLFAAARKIPVTYVVGNHDALSAIDFSAAGKSHFLGSEIRVTPEYTHLPLRLFAAHGHAYDLLNAHDDPLDVREEVPVGTHIARTVGWFEKNVNRKIDNSLEKIYFDYKVLLRQLSRKSKNYAELVTPAHPDYRRLGGNYSEYERGALDVLRSPRYDLCLFGHTHQQLIKRFDRFRDGADGMYVNTGSWVGDGTQKLPPVFVEVTRDDVRMIDAETFEVLNLENRRVRKMTEFGEIAPGALNKKHSRVLKR